MKKIALLALSLALVCESPASAKEATARALIENHSTTPIWVTLYGSDSPLIKTQILEAGCLGWGKTPTGHAFEHRRNYIVVMVEAQKGHGQKCDTGTYWKGEINYMAMQEGRTVTKYAVFAGHANGSSTLNWSPHETPPSYPIVKATWPPLSIPNMRPPTPR